MNCNVCLNSVSNKSKFIDCYNTSCDGGVCIDCCELLLDYSVNNNILPRCPAQKCNYEFLYSDFKKISNEILDIYIELCYKSLKNNNKEDLQIIESYKKYMLDLKNKKRHRIYFSFPSCYKCFG